MEIKTGNNWKQNPNKLSCMDPTIFELWVMEIELWVMETQNPNSPKYPYLYTFTLWLHTPLLTPQKNKKFLLYQIETQKTKVSHTKKPQMKWI